MVTLIPVALLAQAVAELVQHGHCPFLIRSILTDECDGSVIASSMASNSLGAPEEI